MARAVAMAGPDSVAPAIFAPFYIGAHGWCPTHPCLVKLQGIK